MAIFAAPLTELHFHPLSRPKQLGPQRNALNGEGQGDVVPGQGRLSWEESHATQIGIMLYIYIHIHIHIYICIYKLDVE